MNELKYPSLIFNSSGSQVRNDISVFYDIKLDLMLPEKTLELMSYYVSPDEIAKRSEMFDLLQNRRLRESFEKLKSIAENFSEVLEILQHTETECILHLMYLSLCIYYRDFVCLAAEISDGEFGKRFGEFFAKRKDREFESFNNEASDLFERCRSALSFEISVSPEKTFLGPSSGSNTIFAVKAAADNFGVECNPAGYSYIMCPKIAEKAIDVAGISSLLCDFCGKYDGLFDFSISGYANEIGFYLDIISLMERIEKQGITTTQPKISEENCIIAHGVYDITLLSKNESEIIPNDIDLSDESKFCFLIGANGGGKTTYLRCVGVNTLLALNGARTAAKSFCTFDFKKVFTHFPRDERFDRGGRLCDEETRLKPITAAADGTCLVLLNETFSTTMAGKSDEMTESLANELQCKKSIGIYVTHAKIKEESTVPVLCVAVDPDNENKRTYRVEKKSKYKGSFANDILRKYHLDRNSLSKRFGEI